MDFVMHTVAYSLYPTSTLCDQTTLVCGPTTTKIVKALQKYEQCGWKTIPMMTINMIFLHPQSKWIIKFRRIRDHDCWSRQLQPINHAWMAKDDFKFGSWFKWGIQFQKLRQYDDVFEGLTKPLEWVNLR
jgi:hypothetical protein